MMQELAQKLEETQKKLEHALAKSENLTVEMQQASGKYAEVRAHEEKVHADEAATMNAIQEDTLADISAL